MLLITEDFMKKIYIKPYFMVFKVHPVQIIAESIPFENTTDSGNYLDGSTGPEYDNSAWSREENNIFREDHNVWDNLW